ncbi:hypothetical protein KKF84_09720 [Myxococcota bacterium]|nr:hypothetical protein [Myxococcota bacterium]MBU1535589.1 hypothetical protein [Myxococcota bacterium]
MRAKLSPSCNHSSLLLPFAALLFAMVCGGCSDDAKPRETTPEAPGCRGHMIPTQTIGNWDVVPFQRFSGTFEVGVVGFHEEGLDVVFSVNGQEVTTVEEPTLNPRTGVYEYWFSLEATDFADGAVTVSATLIPDCEGHILRELSPLTLYANSTGSLTNNTIMWADCESGDDTSGDGSEALPFQTIERAFVEVGSGGTVNLKAGTCYALTNQLESAGYDLWTTVRAAPGVPREAVSILTYGPDEDLSTGRFGEDMVRWQNVRLYKDVEPGYSNVFYFESGHHVWFDGAELFDARGQWNGGTLLNGNSPYYAYYTGATIRDIQNSGYSFGRDVVMENIGSDVFRGSSGIMSVNLTVLGIDSGTTDAHPDFFQFYNPDALVDNVVVYNTLVYDMGAQGIFGGPGQMANVAFVNLLMEKDPADSALISQITGDWDHVLLWHVTTVDSGFFLRETAQLSNFFIQNCVFSTLHAGDATELPTFTMEHNHVAGLVWDQPYPMGLYPSVGDPLYADESADDYHLTGESPAHHAGAPLPGVPADVEGTLYHTGTPSLGCFASEDSPQ